MRATARREPITFVVVSYYRYRTTVTVSLLLGSLVVLKQFNSSYRLKNRKQNHSVPRKKEMNSFPVCVVRQLQAKKCSNESKSREAAANMEVNDWWLNDLKQKKQKKTALQKKFVWAENSTRSFKSSAWISSHVMTCFANILFGGFYYLFLLLCLYKELCNVVAAKCYLYKHDPYEEEEEDNNKTGHNERARAEMERNGGKE